MTTIHLSLATRRNDGRFQVFGSYEGQDDRYTFGIRSFATLTEAELAAKAMMEKHQADHFCRSL